MANFISRLKAGTWFCFAEVDIEIPQKLWMMQPDKLQVLCHAVFSRLTQPSIVSCQVFCKIVAASESCGVENCASNHNSSAGHFIERLFFQMESGRIF